EDGIRDLIVTGVQTCALPISPAEGADVLAAAGDWNVEKPQFGDHMFPKLFARIAELYTQKYGLSEKQLSTIVLKNFVHAKRNPRSEERRVGKECRMARRRG